MKLKENAIKPGMVIHCPKEEDARALMNHLKDINYVRIDYMVKVYSLYGENTCYKISRSRDGSLTAEYSPIRLYRDDYGYKITEFSDLIEPDDSPVNSDTDSPMSAVEVLEWLRDHYNDYDGEFFTRIFGADYTLSELLIEKKLSPREIVDSITAYEAAKKAPKPVEVEEGWRCEIACHDEITSAYDLWGVTQEAAWDSAINRALSYTRETGKEASADVWYVCRVKENES